MKKSDLKTGMRVRTRNNDIYLVIKDVHHAYRGLEEVAFVREKGFLNGSTYNEDLLNSGIGGVGYDVVEIYQVDSKPESLLTSTILNLDKRVSIWKRDEEKFKIGDTVRVVREGLQYTTYPELIEENCPEYLAYYAYNNDRIQDLELAPRFKVVGKGNHTLNGTPLLVIKKNYGGEVYIIEEDGVEIAD